MAERKTFLLRLDADDFEELRRWAADEFRSLNGQIEFLLRQALVRHRDYRPPRPDTQRKP
ncbi:MAG: Arc family DNA binding domain-containing protein [Acidobacteria bacterium]|nr:Arc family DNA binding domain-containing protein [Acidobacteriota bacterium]